MNDTEHVRIWRWGDAPRKYRALSPHGGDEDYVAFIPAEILDWDWAFMEQGTLFGCARVSKHEVHNGEVWIGAHA